MPSVQKLALLGLTVCLAGLFGQQPPVAVKLQPLGPARRLANRIFGASAIPAYEHLLEDPEKIAELKKMNIAYTRLPGGSDSNYYQPESGKLLVPSTPNPSSYKTFWISASQNINRGHPSGISIEQFKRFSNEIGAEMVLVPNIDTSSVSAQRAWFQGMASKGIVPTHIEMGNEMYLAMMHDPATIAKFPDEPATMRITKQYLDAIQEFLPRGTKIAIQAAPEDFSAMPGGNDSYSAGFRTWNQALKPENWFQAVTVHAYPSVNLLTVGSRANDPVAVFRAVMARYDEGIDRLIERIVARLPGKEIWVTEFNARGGEPGHQQSVTPAVQMHAAARAYFAFLRHPEVALAQYFMLNFDGSPEFSVFLRSGNGFRPLPVAEAVSWFDRAANGGVAYQGFVSGVKMSGGGLVKESFNAVEGALFTSANGGTLLVQNATASPISVDLSALGGGTPSRIESMSPSISALERSAAEVVEVRPANLIELPAYSLTRVIFGM